MATKIEVEWVAQSQTMSAALERINKKLDEQDKKLEEIGKTSKKAADAAAGSFNALQNELRDAETALKNMAAGTAEFEQQRKEVERLKTAVAGAKSQLQEFRPATLAGQLQEMAGAFNEGFTAADRFIGILENMRATQDRVIEGSASVVESIDSMTRSMQVQMGLTDEQARQQREKTLEVARAAGVSPEAAFQAETQLSSSAFDANVLDTILKITQATNFEGNTAEVVQGVAQVLNAYQMDRSQVNTEKLGASLVNLFRDTDLQMQDLGDFAKNASVFENAGLRLEQSLAAFAGLRNIYQGSEAGTGLRNFVGILQASAGDQSKTDALASMGLKPEQVDFVGEDLIQVIQTLRDATSKMGAEDSNVAMSKIFGRENVAVANTLLNMDTQIQQFTEIQGNIAALEEKAIVKRESMEAERNRLELDVIRKKIENEDQIFQLEIERLQRKQALDAKLEEAALRGPLDAAVADAQNTIANVLTVVPGLSDPTNANKVGAMILPQLEIVANLLKEREQTIKAGGLAAPQLEIIAQILGGLLDETKAVRVQNEQNAKRPVIVQPVARPQEQPLPGATPP